MAGKDAVFLSPHKFPGGPGTPGVLVAKRALLRRPVPSVPGGGTIVFVSPTGRPTTRSPRSARRRGRRRSSSRSAPASCSRSRRRSAPRRSGGARATSPAARSRRWGANPNLRILGNPSASGSRSSRSASATRAGCCTRTSSSRCSATCSGSRRAAAASAPARTSTAPTRSTTTWSAACTRRRGCGQLGAKLAFARVSFDYFMSEAVFDYIVDAVHLIANEGWKLLPLYRFDPGQRPVAPRRRSRAAAPTLAIAFDSDAARLPATAPESALARQLDEARRIIRARAAQRLRRRRRWRRTSSGSAGSRCRASAPNDRGYAAPRAHPGPLQPRRKSRHRHRGLVRPRRRVRQGPRRGRRRRRPRRPPRREARGHAQARRGRRPARDRRARRRLGPDSCQALVDQTMQDLGRVDVLVNNAGVGTAVPASARRPTSSAR